MPGNNCARDREGSETRSSSRLGPRLQRRSGAVEPPAVQRGEVPRSVLGPSRRSAGSSVRSLDHGTAEAGESGTGACSGRHGVGGRAPPTGSAQASAGQHETGLSEGRGKQWTHLAPRMSPRVSAVVTLLRPGATRTRTSRLAPALCGCLPRRVTSAGTVSHASPTTCTWAGNSGAPAPRTTIGSLVTPPS